MAHINRSRQVSHVWRISLRRLMPEGQIPNSFAVFCGSAHRRSAIGLHAIRQCRGKVGVVFLHNDPSFALQLANAFPSDSKTALHVPNPPNASQFHYDPLYGLPEEAVLDLIVPPCTNSASSPAVDAIRARLRNYLSIMEYQFRRSPEMFGRYPYNLDLLVQLTQMPYPQLESTVLNHLPPALGNSLKEQLSAGNAQASVRDAVNNFTPLMNRYLWTPRNFRHHTEISIYQAVADRSIISVYVPNSAPGLLDYIEQELQALTDAQYPFFLIESGLNLTKSPSLRERFMGQHAQLNYRTGILSATPTNILSPNLEDFGNLIREHHDVLVLECAGDAEADIFSRASGSYYRQVTTTHEGQSRGPFQIFSGHTSGTDVTEHEDRNVRTHELTALGQGALLFSHGFSDSVLIRNLIL